MAPADLAHPAEAVSQKAGGGDRIESKSGKSRDGGKGANKPNTGSDKSRPDSSGL